MAKRGASAAGATSSRAEIDDDDDDSLDGDDQQPQAKLAVRSVARSIDILMCLTDGPQTLSVVALRTKLSKGTCHRLLTTLGHRQLVVQDPLNGVYLLGPGCSRFVDAIRGGFGGVGPMARPILSALREATGETVTLHIRLGDQRVCTEEMPSPHPVRFAAGIGSADPIHLGSAGKMILAMMADDERAEMVKASWQRTASTWSQQRLDSLMKELTVIRQQGWAESRGERVVGAAAVSAAVVDEQGRCVAVVSVLGPESRMPESTMKVMRKQVRDAAASLSQMIAAPDRVPLAAL